MKIRSFYAAVEDDHCTSINVSLDVGGEPLLAAVDAVLRALRPLEGLGSPGPDITILPPKPCSCGSPALDTAVAPAEPPAEPAPVDPPASRRRRVAETPAVAPPEPPAPAQAEPSRRRRAATVEPEAPKVPVISDADLSKACSNAAPIVGVEVVMAILREFGVEKANALPQDQRQKFLNEVAEEIRLSEEEAQKA